jgi:hypothetical protein
MENDYYISEKNKYIENFLKENKQYLYDLTSNLFVLFSEESLEDLAKLYHETFESCLNKINNELHKNKLLSKEYLDNLNAVINNKTKIIELLKNYHTDDKHLVKVTNYDPAHYSTLRHFEDTITSQSSTEGYKKKFHHPYFGLILIIDILILIAYYAKHIPNHSHPQTHSYNGKNISELNSLLKILLILLLRIYFLKDLTLENSIFQFLKGVFL